MTLWDCAQSYMLLFSIVKVGTGTATQYHAINRQYAMDTIYDYQWNYLTSVSSGGLGGMTCVISVNNYFWAVRQIGDFFRYDTTWANMVMATGNCFNYN